MDKQTSKTRTNPLVTAANLAAKKKAEAQAKAQAYHGAQAGQVHGPAHLDSGWDKDTQARAARIEAAKEGGAKFLDS